MKKYSDSNKYLWDELTEIHEKENSHYSIKDFKSGKNSLSEVEIRELGNISGKKILNLQCHFGLDTLSLSRIGAKVTGVDFSEKSIYLAKSLSKETGIKARFICSDIYNLPRILNEKFDTIFTSCGVLLWLPDLKEWAKIVYHFLRPRGFFYILEGHPFSMTLKKYKKLYVDKFYFPDSKPNKGKGRDYTGKRKKLKNTAYTWNHNLSEIINSLINSGLKIDYLHEFPFSREAHYPNMEFHKEGWWFKGKKKMTPLMFSIKATKEVKE